MQTVQELIQNASQLDELMAEAEKNKFAIHALVKVDDEYTRNSYLTLLMSTVALIEKTEAADNPCSYVCRIATAFQEKPDMQEILRRSLIIDEKTLKDYAKTLQQNDLQNLFLFDAISILKIYDKGNTTLKDYIAGVAEMFSIEKEESEEISLAADMVINCRPDFTHKFSNANVYTLLPHIQANCKNIFVESPDVFFLNYEQEHDVSGFWENSLTVENKKLVHFQNIYLHDKKFSFNIRKCQNVEFLNCHFEKLGNETVQKFIVEGDTLSMPTEMRLMTFENMESVKLQNCNFSSIINNLILPRTSQSVMFLEMNYMNSGIYGTLIFVANIKNIIVHDCKFKDCFFRELFEFSIRGLRISPIEFKGSYYSVYEFFNTNYYTSDDVAKYFSVHLDGDNHLIGGYNIDGDDVKNIETENSFHF